MRAPDCVIGAAAGTFATPPTWGRWAVEIEDEPTAADGWSLAGSHVWVLTCGPAGRLTSGATCGYAYIASASPTSTAAPALSESVVLTRYEKRH